MNDFLVLLVWLLVLCIMFIAVCKMSALLTDPKDERFVNCALLVSLPSTVDAIRWGYFSSHDWHWHPVFVILTGLTILMGFVFIYTFIVCYCVYKQIISGIVASSIAALIFGVEAWRVSTYIFDLDVMWSELIGITYFGIVFLTLRPPIRTLSTK